MSTVHPKRPGHFKKREFGFFTHRNARIVKLLTGANIEPTEKHYDDYARMCWEGDPLADAVVDWFREVSFVKGRAMIEQALDHGIESLDNPPQCLIDLFAQVDKDPFWLDRDLLAEGAQAIHRSGPLGLFVLGDIALMGGYAISSVMNKSLVFTGALEDNSQGRLAETGKWWMDVTSEGGLDRFGKGTRTTVLVRIMHAMVRMRLRKHEGWDFEELGMPISQAHMLSTNMAFGVLFIQMTNILGVRYSKRERKAMMHLWRYAGMLGGIDEAYNFESEVEGLRVLWLSATSQPPADEDAIALANALLDVSPFEGIGGRYEQRLKDAVIGLRLGLTQMGGPGMLRDLQLPADKAWRWSPLAIRAGFTALELGRAVIPGGKRLQAKVGRGILDAMQNARPREEAKFKPVDDLKHDVKMAAE